jgi:hypothetical protein
MSENPARPTTNGRWRWRWRRFKFRLHRLRLSSHPDRHRALRYHYAQDLLLQNAECTPRAGDELLTLSVTTVEYFTPSTVHRLHQSLRRLRLGQDVSLPDRDPGRWISAARSREGRAGWYNLGYIYRKSRKRIYANGACGPVPLSFEHVSVQVHAVSPSLTACTLTFHLKAEIQTQITDRLAKFRFPEFVSFGHAYSVLDPEAVKAAAINQFRMGLRAEVHQWGKRHLPGFFSTENAEARPCLELNLYTMGVHSDPRGEVWGLAGLGREFNRWKRESEAGGQLIFPSQPAFERVTHAFLFLNSEDVSTEDMRSYGGTKADIAYPLADELGEIVLSWGLQALLSIMREKVSIARDNQLGLGRIGARGAVQRLQSMTIQNADVQSVCGELQNTTRSRRLDRSYAYRGGDWARKEARDDLLAWFWSAAAKSAKRLARFDHDVRALAQQQGTLMVAEQNLRLQTWVWFLAVVAAISGLVSAYEPATRLWPAMRGVIEAAFAVAGR